MQGCSRGGALTLRPEPSSESIRPKSDSEAAEKGRRARADMVEKYSFGPFSSLLMDHLLRIEKGVFASLDTSDNTDTSGNSDEL